MKQLTDKEATLYDVLSLEVWYHWMVSDMFPALLKKGYVIRQERGEAVFYKKIEKSVATYETHMADSLANHPWLRQWPITVGVQL